MEKYYYSYANYVGYMEESFEKSYSLNTQVYAYAKACYGRYGRPENDYETAYSDYARSYRQLRSEYQEYKNARDMAGMQRAYMQMNEINRQFYEASMSVYSHYKQSYGNETSEDTPLYHYVNYMDLYIYYQKTYYANYYSRYSEARGYYYSVAMLKADDILTYPHREIGYSEDEKQRLEQTYSKHGLVVPVIVTSKIGDDGRAYYHLLDGYHMLQVAKENGQQYVPALVYKGLPKDVEESYMANPYFGYNYK